VFFLVKQRGREKKEGSKAKGKGKKKESRINARGLKMRGDFFLKKNPPQHLPRRVIFKKEGGGEKKKPFRCNTKGRNGKEKKKEESFVCPIFPFGRGGP